MRTVRRIAVASACLMAAAAAAVPSATAAKKPPTPGISTASIAYFSYTIRRAGGETSSQEDIFTLDTTTERINRLTDDRRRTSVSDRDPAWSPDRTKLAIFRSDGETPPRLAVIDARTGITLRDFPDALGLAPEWLSNTQIAYHNGGYPNGDLFVLDYATGQSRQLTAATEGESFVSAAWDPVKGLAVNRVPMQFVPPTEEGSEGYWDPGGADILVFTPQQVDAALAGAPLTAASGVDVTGPRGLTWSWDPSWSPTESKILLRSGHWTWSYEGSDENGQPTTYTAPLSEIVLVDLEKDGYTRITADVEESIGGSDGSPVFSPDGSRIAWARGFEDAWSEVVLLDTAAAGTSTAWSVVGNERQVRFKGALDW